MHEAAARTVNVRDAGFFVIEALRLQKERASRLGAEDFGDVALHDAAAKAGASIASGRQLDDALAELPFSLRSSAGGVQFESVARDVSGLSDAALVKALEADAPELLHLLGDFKETLRDARSKVAPLVAA